jgi:hypothetical protein
MIGFRKISLTIALVSPLLLAGCVGVGYSVDDYAYVDTYPYGVVTPSLVTPSIAVVGGGWGDGYYSDWDGRWGGWDGWGGGGRHWHGHHGHHMGHHGHHMGHHEGGHHRR